MLSVFGAIVRCCNNADESLEAEFTPLMQKAASFMDVGSRCIPQCAIFYVDVSLPLPFGRDTSRGLHSLGREVTGWTHPMADL